MRLFDNSAIKIDLFPGRKDKKNGKTKNTTRSKQPRTVASNAHNATQQIEKDEPISTVKTAKSMQNMDRPTYQRPNTSRSLNNYTTSGTRVYHSASESDQDYDRPSTGYSERSDTSRTYQQPWSSSTQTEHETFGIHEQQGPSWYRSEKSAMTGNHDYCEPHVPESDTNGRSSSDQRRSRADLQDEWVADQKSRTNIPKGAPHSTGHALKHKRSKADMIRATENMARTLSRSPQRSPANRRQLSAVDEVRPGTSSSTGSSRLPHHIQSNNTQHHGFPRTTGELSGASKLSQGQQQASASSATHTSTTANPNQTHQVISNSSDHNNQTDQQPQFDGLSPSKVSGVAKKQGKAFQSTIRTSPPLSMEPNKTTWSPTSSVPRRDNHSRTRSEQKKRSTTNRQSRAMYGDSNSSTKGASSDEACAQRSTTQSNASADTDAGLNHSNQYDDNNCYVHDDSLRQNKNRSSIDNKKSDHLSLAQRQNLANSQHASQQPQAIVSRSNGMWASQDESVNDSSANPRSDSSDTGLGSSASEGNHSHSGGTRSQYMQNYPAQRTTSLDSSSKSESNSGPPNTASHQGTRVKSSLHEISYMKNYSRPSGNDSSPRYGRTLDYSRPDTDESSASSTSASNNMNNKNTQPITLATQAKDFAHQAPSDLSTGDAQQKNATNDTSGTQSKYVDAGSSTKSPFQGHFGSGKNASKDPTRDEHARSKTSAKSSNNGIGGNKFSSSNIVKHNLNDHTNESFGDSRTIKKKPSLTLNNNIPKNSSSRNKDVQAPGRAKVVCINNGGSTIVDTPVTANFTIGNKRQSVSYERKDSGQSDSWDFGGTSTYSNKQN